MVDVETDIGCDIYGYPVRARLSQASRIAALSADLDAAKQSQTDLLILIAGLYEQIAVLRADNARLTAPVVAPVADAASKSGIPSRALSGRAASVGLMSRGWDVV